MPELRMKRREFVFSIVLLLVGVLAIGYERFPAQAFVAVHRAASIPFLASKPGASLTAPTLHSSTVNPSTDIPFLAFKPAAGKGGASPSPSPGIAFEAKDRYPTVSQTGTLYTFASTDNSDRIAQYGKPFRHTKPHDMPKAGTNALEFFQKSDKSGFYWVINNSAYYNVTASTRGSGCLISPVGKEPVKSVMTMNPVYLYPNLTKPACV
jgi:hypothetical protein